MMEMEMAPERDEPPYASAPEYQSILFFLTFICDVTQQTLFWKIVHILQET
jgi:hypothetical protein